MSRLEQETTCINGFRPASALAVNHMVKVKSSKIAQYVCAISRLHKHIAQSQDCLHNLEIGTQFRDSENALRNLEIAQIPKLRGTDTCGKSPGTLALLAVPIPRSPTFTFLPPFYL